jgi:hypothetical protein
MVLTRGMEFSTLLDEKLKNLATKADFDGLRTSILDMISSRDKKIEVLESKVSILENSIGLLAKRANDQEQYSRRTCLRIEGIDDKDSQNEIKCIQKIKEVIKEAKLDIPAGAVDRAHRNGVYFQNKIKKNAVIVKFNTFYARTILYKARKSFKDLKIRLDLTRENYSLLREAQRAIKEKTKLDENVFAFADTNCRLMIKLRDDKFVHFNSTDDLEDIISREL